MAHRRDEITIVEFHERYARETIAMWRASKESAIGIKDKHSFDDHVDFLCNRLSVSNNVYLAICKTTNSVTGIMAVDAPELNQLYIHTDYQHRGIGTRLLDLAKQESNGTLQLFTFEINTIARAFYEKHGFRVIGSGFENEEGLPDLRYEWQRHV